MQLALNLVEDRAGAPTTCLMSSDRWNLVRRAPVTPFEWYRRAL